MIEQQTIQEEASLGREQTIRRLQSKMPAVQEEAEHSLITQETAGLEMLLDILRQEAKKRHKRTSLLLILILTQAGFGITLLTYVYSTILRVLQHTTSSTHFHGWHSFFLVEAAFLVAINTLTGLIAYLASPMTRLERRAAHAIARFDDIRAVGPLITAYVTSPLNGFFFARLFKRGETAQKKILALRLKALLPKMKAGDTSLMSSQQRQCLYSALILSEDAELVLAVLKALEQIGDSRALPCVEKLATGKIRTIDAGTRNVRHQMWVLQLVRSRRARKAEEQIRKAALACLPFLQTKAAEGEQTLLRAADTAS